MSKIPKKTFKNLIFKDCAMWSSRREEYLICSFWDDDIRKYYSFTIYDKEMFPKIKSLKVDEKYDVIFTNFRVEDIILSKENKN